MGRRMLCHINVNDLSPVVGQDDEDEQDFER